MWRPTFSLPTPLVPAPLCPPRTSPPRRRLPARPRLPPHFPLFPARSLRNRAPTCKKRLSLISARATRNRIGLHVDPCSRASLPRAQNKVGAIVGGRAGGRAGGGGGGGGGAASGRDRLESHLKLAGRIRVALHARGLHSGRICRPPAGHLSSSSSIAMRQPAAEGHPRPPKTKKQRQPEHLSYTPFAQSSKPAPTRTGAQVLSGPGERNHHLFFIIS